MLYYVYVLYSRQLNKYYTGFSRFHAKRRRQHLHGQSKWTSQTDDWIEVFYKIAETQSMARALEKQIKGRGAARYITESGSRG